MLRIAHISPLPPQESGEAPYAAQLIRALAETGKARILAIAGTAAQPLPIMHGRIETEAVWRNRSLFYPFSLLRLIKKWRPHIVHVQFGPHGSSYGGFFGEIMLFLLLVLRLTGTCTTITLHSTWMPNQVKDRIIAYNHLKYLVILAVPLFKIYMRVLSWATDTIQLSTAKLGSVLKDKFLCEYDINSQKILEIPHPCKQTELSITQSAAKSQLKINNRDVILVFGFIRPGKGIETAIKAMDLLRGYQPRALLLIAGTPSRQEGNEYLKELRLLVQNLNLDEHVAFHVGFVPENIVPVYFSAASIVLVPYSESVGVSGPIHNYAAYGTPIVASNVGFHMRESLGGNLVLFRAGDSNDLVKQLSELLADKNLANQLSESQVKYTKSENWEIAAQRTLKNYTISIRFRYPLL